MESLIGDFVQFFCPIASFLFLEWRLGTRLCLRSNFQIFLKMFSFPKILSLKAFGDL